MKIINTCTTKNTLSHDYEFHKKKKKPYACAKYSEITSRHTPIFFIFFHDVVCEDAKKSPNFAVFSFSLTVSNSKNQKNCIIYHIYIYATR